MKLITLLKLTFKFQQKICNYRMSSFVNFKNYCYFETCNLCMKIFISFKVKSYVSRFFYMKIYLFNYSFYEF